MAEPGSELRVLVCGGGNGAHTLAGLAASRAHVEVRVMSLFADEAERWSRLLEEGELTVNVKNKDGSTSAITSRPRLVTDDPERAVPGCSIIILTVPAFAHEQYFRAMAAHVDENAVVVGLPSQPGFQFQCVDCLGERGRRCAIVSFESLPWACRVQAFGRSVQVLGVKDTLSCAVTRRQAEPAFAILPALQRLVGARPVLTLADNYIEINLLADSVVHPPIMYGTWRDWDGRPVAERPAFYQGLSELAARVLSAVSDELVATGRAVQRRCPALDMGAVIHIFDWYKLNYRDSIGDASSLRSAMRTNSAYDGLVHPMKESEEGGFVPDFGYRYLTEDVPFGMVVFRGISQLAGVETPVMDEVIRWSQKILNKEFLVGSELTGKDMGSTRAPQRYGFKSLDDLVNLR